VAGLGSWSKGSHLERLEKSEGDMVILGTGNELCADCGVGHATHADFAVKGAIAEEELETRVGVVDDDPSCKELISMNSMKTFR
jgi:hypothetical protein